MNMQQLSLNGAWTVTQTGTHDEIPAQVPGTIHQDLLAAGRIEDPYYRDNEDALQWIGETGWIYRHTFTVTEAFLTHARILLRCDGLDTLATVTINGLPVARTDNMFRTWEFDVKRLLLAGENTIEICFDPAVAYIQQRQTNRGLPCWSNPREMKGRCWIRKEPANFGWDWGPILVTCGIWRPIALVAFDTARLTDLQIRQDHTQSGEVTLGVTATLDSASDEPLQASFAVEYQGHTRATANVDLSGSQSSVNLVVAEPRLWWPNGMGDQPLYTVRCTLQTAAGTVVDATSRRIGLRTLRLQRVQDTWGESFQFAVNGVPFFAKGANWIPADTFAPRVTRAQYANLLGSAAAANMNMIRAWGGGIYEEDAFYDLCDELGLCVWQDFLFACSTYPTFDEDFTRSALAEVVDNVTRLRNHPSIALWCGNNELEMGLVGQEWEASQMSWNDYTRLFDNLLPEMVQLLDPERDYWPGSPHSPYGNREDHSSPRWGDAHLWDVWHKKQPFDWYRTTEHRFISEFGFQSFPEPKTVEAFTLPEDRNVTSYIMEHHQRSVIGNSTILTYMLDWFMLPATFEMTLWLSQILHGIGMQYGVEHWRRNMARTMGTLYWQLNDCWPVASWASIDYFGRWKAPHYLAKRFYAPLLISGVEDAARGTVDIHVTSDLPQPREGTVRWYVTDTDGQLLTDARHQVLIAAHADALVAVADAQQLLRRRNRRDMLVWLELWVDGACVSTNLATFVRPKHLTLHDPRLAVSVQRESATEYLVSITADKPALWAWLTNAELEARYADNFLHVQPGTPAQVRVTIAEATTADDFTRDLRVYSLFDTYQPASIQTTGDDLGSDRLLTWDEEMLDEMIVDEVKTAG
ncbi:MAG: beta-mannosidase [Armatimonadota bacterium]